MAALVCGSLAFDSIATFPGRFADQILANQLHVLNVSFLVPTPAPRVRRLRRQHRLQPGAARRRADRRWPPSAATATTTWRGCARGARAPSTCARSARRSRRRPSSSPTSTTTRSPRFTPARCSGRTRPPVPARGDIRIAIIAPDGRERDARARAAARRRAGIPFIFDPGQGLPMFDGAELRAFVDRATLGRPQRLRSADARRAHRPLDRGDVALAPARRRRHARRARLRGLAAGREDDACRRRGERGASTRPAAATPFAAPCCTASSAAGRWTIARASATAWARSRSPAAAARIMCWIARLRAPDRPPRSSSAAVDPKSLVMDIRQAGVLAVAIPVALVVASVATWAVCRWWYGRKLRGRCAPAAEEREGAALLAAADRAGAPADRASSRPSSSRISKALPSIRRRAAAPPSSKRRSPPPSERPAEPTSACMPLVSAHGFADTQILPGIKNPAEAGFDDRRKRVGQGLLPVGNGQAACGLSAVFAGVAGAALGAAAGRSRLLRRRPSWPTPSWQAPSWQAPSWQPSSRLLGALFLAPTSWPPSWRQTSWPPSWRPTSSPPSWRTSCAGLLGRLLRGLLGGLLGRRLLRWPSSPATSSRRPSWPATSWRRTSSPCDFFAAFFAVAITFLLDQVDMEPPAFDASSASGYSSPANCPGGAPQVR